MQIVNYTPFTPFTFSPLDKVGNEYQVIIIKGTFDIVPDSVLAISSTQDPLTMADEFHGKPGYSSVKRESDLVAFKPKAEILIANAVAKSPEGLPMESWEIGIMFRSTLHRFRVTGPRAWKFLDRKWCLSDAVPVTEVELKYENAFGGFWQSNETSGVCKENPVGCGMVNVDSLDKTLPVRAPQIESLDDPVREIGKEYAIAGLGPIHRSWQPRLGLAGDFDDKWKAEKWPLLPDNFDDGHNNAAPLFLTFSECFAAGEKVRLLRLTQEGRLEFMLPSLDVFVLKRYLSGAIAAEPMRLDTLEIDLATNKGYLVWRLSIPPLPAIRLAEVRMIVNG